jgi:hypothetical protein
MRIVDADGGDMGRGWGLARLTERSGGAWGFLSMQYPRWLAWLFWPLRGLMYRIDRDWSFTLWDRDDPRCPYGPSGGMKRAGGWNWDGNGWRVSYLLLPLWWRRPG